MLDLTPAQVAEALGVAITPGTRSAGEKSTKITSVVTDSRDVTPGSLFIAIAGERADGHDFLEAVFADGAAAAIVSREVGEQPGPTILVDDVVAALGALARIHLARLRERSPDLKVVAVTGSVGKTTTKDLLGQVLAPLGQVITPPASFNNEIGLPLTVLRAAPQTRVLVLEMGTDAPGNLEYLTSIAPPDIAVVLIVAGAHLETFGSVEGVAAAKEEILHGLVPGGIGVLNADNGPVSAMAKSLPPEQVRLFGERQGVDFRAADVHTDSDGKVHFTLQEGEASVEIEVGLIGEHNLTNALAAASVGRLLGVTPEQIQQVLRSAAPKSAHRMHVVDVGGIRVIDDAYNANPTSMRAALKTLADMASRTQRRSVAVLGEMRELGEDSIAEHDGIGRLVVRLNIDKLLTIGDGTRALHSGAYQEGSWGEEAAHVDTFAEAHEWFAQELQQGDIVLFKSSNGAGLARLAGEVIANLEGAPK